MRQGLAIFIVTSALLLATTAFAAGPTTTVQGEYLMTLYVPIAEAWDRYALTQATSLDLLKC
jgi:Ca2+/H+ antiporter